MPELVIKVGSTSPDPAHWQDGDIIMACNDRAIGCAHSERVCDLKNNPFTTEGLRDISGLNYKRKNLTSLSMFTRVSPTEVRWDDLVSLTSKIISNIPNAQGHYMHVSRHLIFLMSEPTLRVFGSVGSEVWFGDDDNRISVADIDAVWNMIETDSPHRRSSFREFPFSDAEISHNLMLSVDDMTDDESSILTESEVVVDSISTPDGPVLSERIVKKRKKFVDWSGLYLAADRLKIRDKELKTDHRRDPVQRTRSGIVKVRT